MEIFQVNWFGIMGKAFMVLIMPLINFRKGTPPSYISLNLKNDYFLKNVSEVISLAAHKNAYDIGNEKKIQLCIIVDSAM